MPSAVIMPCWHLFRLFQAGRRVFLDANYSSGISPIISSGLLPVVLHQI